MDNFEAAQFNGSFQSKILASLLSDRLYLIRIIDILIPEYFESEMDVWIFEVIRDYFLQYRTTPSLDVFKVKVNEFEDDVKKQYVARLKEVYTHIKNADDLEFIKERTLEFCKNQKYKNAILEAADSLQNGDYDAIKAKIDDAANAGRDNDIGLVWKDQVDYRYEKSARDATSSGWEVIDNITEGGFAAGELITIIAPSGAGKSWALANVGYSFVEKGKTVVHYTLELNDVYTATRYDALATGYEISDLKYHKEAIKSKMQSIKGDLIIKEWATKGATINTLRASLDLLRAVGKSPDLIIIDYADLMNYKTGNQSNHEALEELYQYLRGIAGEYRCPLITASQTNRGAVEHDVVTAVDVGASYGKVATADFIMSLARKTEDKLANTGRIHVIKNRMGADGMVFPSKINMRNGRFELYEDDSINGKELTNEMKQGESLIKKHIRDYKGELG